MQPQPGQRIGDPACGTGGFLLANPPFGKKGGYTIVGEDGRITTEKQEYERDEFWATTANKHSTFSSTSSAS